MADALIKNLIQRLNMRKACLTCLSYCVLQVIFTNSVVGADHGFKVSGSITDIRFTVTKRSFTNTLSVEGIRSDKGLLLEVTPVRSEDGIAESFGWDGDKLRIVQRYPSNPQKNLLRDKSLGYVESTIFSRYATHPSAGLLLAMASKDQLAVLQRKEEPFILGGQRIYPEEQNEYRVQHLPEDGFTITATSPGRVLTQEGEEKIPQFEQGFKRWVIDVKIMQKQTNSFINFDYQRFFPENGKLFLYRQVYGTMQLRKRERIT